MRRILEFSRHLDHLRFLADHKVTGNLGLLEWMGLAATIDLIVRLRSMLRGSSPP
jgi:hypothetical protein